MDSDFFARIAEVEGFIPEEDLVESSCDYVLNHDPKDAPSTMLLRSLTKLLQEERSDLEDSVLEAAVDYCLEGSRRIRHEQYLDEPEQPSDPRAVLSTFYSRAASFLYVLGDRKNEESFFERSIDTINKALRYCACSRARAYHRASRGMASLELGKLRSDKDLLLAAFKDLQGVKDLPDPVAHQLFMTCLADAAYWLMELGYDASNMARFALDTYGHMRANFENSRDLAVLGFNVANCHVFLSHEGDTLSHLSEAYKNIKAVLDYRPEEDILPIAAKMESVILEYAKICPDEVRAEAYRTVAKSKAMTGRAGLDGKREIDFSVSFKFASDYFFEASQYESDFSQKIEDLETAIEYGLLCSRYMKDHRWGFSMCSLGKMYEHLYDLTKEMEYRDKAVESFRSAANYLEKHLEFHDTVSFCNKSAQSLAEGSSKLSRRFKAALDTNKDLRHEAPPRPKKKYSRSKPDFRDTEWWE